MVELSLRDIEQILLAVQFSEQAEEEICKGVWKRSEEP